MKLPPSETNDPQQAQASESTLQKVDSLIQEVEKFMREWCNGPTLADYNSKLSTPAHDHFAKQVADWKERKTREQAEIEERALWLAKSWADLERARQALKADAPDTVGLGKATTKPLSDNAKNLRDIPEEASSKVSNRGGETREMEFKRIQKEIQAQRNQRSR
ncbi:MAG: hypothetical protein VXZ38_02190 [Planctomycetota bacterium]|nr:hypothetical protein [Planctomycetota bacterium]